MTAAALRPRAPGSDELARRLWAVLPQTQCTRCGYPDCAAYAQAIADGQAPINRCPPGGAGGIERLAAVTGQPVQALDSSCGVEGPRRLARIDETWCIGCTLCLPACPTDAIVGANKRLHQVIDTWCTGCELCVPVCPVDCIVMTDRADRSTGWSAWGAPEAEAARIRYTNHSDRRLSDARRQQERLKAKAQEALADLPGHSRITDADQLDTKRRILEAALARAALPKTGQHGS